MQRCECKGPTSTSRLLGMHHDSSHTPICHLSPNICTFTHVHIHRIYTNVGKSVT